MTVQEIDDLMDELDGDGGGDIDFNEFYNCKHYYY
jgi:Ca2+-binding EF-hand superfamily protein